MNSPLITCIDCDHHHFCLSLNFLKFQLFGKVCFNFIKLSVFCFISFFFLLLFFISFLFFVSFVFIGVRTIVPEENCCPVRVRVQVSVRIRVRVGGYFFSGATVLEPFLPVKNKEILDMPTKCQVSFIYYMCKTAPLMVFFTLRF